MKRKEEIGGREGSSGEGWKERSVRGRESRKVEVMCVMYVAGRLMHVCNANCQYDEAERTYHRAMQYVTQLHQYSVTVNTAALHSEYSTLLFARSQYEEVTDMSLLTVLLFGWDAHVF